MERQLTNGSDMVVGSSEIGRRGEWTGGAIARMVSGGSTTLDLEGCISMFSTKLDHSSLLSN